MVLSLLNLYEPAVFKIDILVHLCTVQVNDLEISNMASLESLESGGYLLISIGLINPLLALYVTREVLANEEIVCPTETFISF